MKRLSATLAALLTTVLLPAQSAADEAVVRIFADGVYSGTGVVVARSPPVIATCYHVIQGHGRIGVFFAWQDPKAYPQGVSVVKVAPFPHQDVAFLRTDADSVGVAHSSMEPSIVPSAPSLDDLQGAYWWLDLDWSPDSHPSSTELHFPRVLDKLGQYSNPKLASLGLPPADNAPVVMLNPAHDLVPGNSGAPVLSGTRLVALVAGVVKNSRNFFGVMIPPVPGEGAADWKNLPEAVVAPTRYGARHTINTYSVPVRTLLSGRFPRLRTVQHLYVDAARCMDTIEGVVGAYEGDYAAMPTSFSSDRVPEKCGRYLRALESRFASLQEEDAKVERERTNEREASAALSELDSALDLDGDADTVCDAASATKFKRGIQGLDAPDEHVGPGCSATHAAARDHEAEELRVARDRQAERREASAKNEALAKARSDAAWAEVSGILALPPP